MGGGGLGVGGDRWSLGQCQRASQETVLDLDLPIIVVVSALCHRHRRPSTPPVSSAAMDELLLCHQGGEGTGRPWPASPLEQLCGWGKSASKHPPPCSLS